MKMAKFRSWNEELRQFFYWEDGIYQRCGVDREEFCIGLFNWQNAEQSTGLFDKNGKEIYVGDKVKWHDYDNFGCCFEYESIVEQEKGGAYITDTPDGTGSYYVWGKSDELEIIGNIHEGEQYGI
jgi:uncharacterized phage protein (TIGR01671 family)